MDLPKLRDGDVRAVFSVLYEPFAEFDLDEPYGAPPETSYFGNLIGRLKTSRATSKVDPAGSARGGPFRRRP